jgi:hypothetical protein
VVATLGGPPAEERGKMGPLHPNGAHQLEGGAWDAMVWCGGDGSGDLDWRRGKVVMGAPEGFFYRSRSPGGRGTSPRIQIPTELEILS